MIYNWIKLLAVVSIFCSCGSSDSNSTLKQKDTATNTAVTPSTTVSYTYDLSSPQKKWVLPDNLSEISGNTWIDKNHLLVIEDLHPNLYLVRLDDKAVIEKTIPFGPETGDKFDIEDVTTANGTAYALWSHGGVYKINNWNDKPQVDKVKTFLKKGNNTEGICYDPVSKNLLIACKNESDVEDEKKSTRSVYMFDINSGSLQDAPFLLLHKKDFKNVTDQKVDFYPSAIAVHPVTHDIYILSTKDTKCLAQYSYKGELKSVQFIDKDLMAQPEGLCFSPDGTLYISTEGKNGTPPYIFQFDYKK